MNTVETIKNRRSIRKFSNNEIDRNIIENILRAGINAPSPKNVQPWKFVVVTKENKHELIKVIEEGIENIKSSFGFITESGNFISSADATLKIMKEAPVIILVLNTNSKQRHSPVYGQARIKECLELTNILSFGAAVENMLLASCEYGIGSLWIGDIYFTIREIGEWLQTDMQIVSAIALGYPDEDPPPANRKEIAELVEWK